MQAGVSQSDRSCRILQGQGCTDPGLGAGSCRILQSPTGPGLDGPGPADPRGPLVQHIERGVAGVPRRAAHGDAHGPAESRLKTGHSQGRRGVGDGLRARGSRLSAVFVGARRASGPGAPSSSCAGPRAFQ
eukprot:3784538-Pyramimonas_sp.AAC.1